MGRRPCCDKVGLKKGPWTTEEDQKLLAYIQEHGHGSWRALPTNAGLKRCGKSCRLRWTNYLRPDIKRGDFSLQEEQTIIQLHALLGNRWAAIASHLHKRTDNEIKNHWNTHLKKRLVKMGIDPVTHKPTSHALGCSCGGAKDMAKLSHMAQWETARLEAEARIVRESVSSKIIITTPKNPNHDHQLSESSLLINEVRSMMIPRSQPRPPCLDVLNVWQSSWSTTNPSKNMSVNGAFNPNNTLESPTSVFSFSVINTLNSTPSDGLFHGNNSFATIYLNNNHASANNNDNYSYNQDEVKSLMDGSLMDVYNGSLGDSSMFPSFNMERFADLCDGINGVRANNSDDLSVLCGGVLEGDKISYWSNMLNGEPSPIHSPVF